MQIDAENLNTVQYNTLQYNYLHLFEVLNKNMYMKGTFTLLPAYDRDKTHYAFYC